jgi:hypothetical protein
MATKKKNKTTTSASLTTLRIGSRVRCTDDGMEGRITWANGVAVKIQWDDGEQVTWKRDSLAERPIAILDADVEEDRSEEQAVATEPAQETPEPTTTEPEPTAEQTAPESEPPAKPKRQRKLSAEPKEKKVSALDAAAKVLAEEGQPMTCKEMIEAMAAKGYWTSPGGKTPEATLYSAILRELGTKGEQARFTKTERGKFSRKT